jgi:sulfoquinovosidase
MRLALIVVVASVSCVPDTLGNVAVSLSDDDTALTLTPLSDVGSPVVVAASQVRFATQQAFFDMQFGMFDIAEAPPSTVERGKTFAWSGTVDGVAEWHVLNDSKTAIGILGISVDGDHITLIARPADADAIDRDVVRRVEARAFLGFDCAAGDHVLGLGAQTADVDHKGQIVPLWVSEQGVGKTDSNDLPTLWQVTGRKHSTHVPVPAFLSSRRFAVAVDTPAFARFDLCATNPTQYEFEVWENKNKIHIFLVQSVAQAQKNLSAFVGKPKPLPSFGLGVWLDAIFGNAAVRAFATRVREANIPATAIWTEDFRGGEDAGAFYRLDEDWGVDPVLYPNFPSLVSDLKAQEFRMMVYFNSFIADGADVFEEVKNGGMGLRDASGALLQFQGADREFSPTTLADLTRPTDRALVIRKMREAIDAGVSGWMGDFAEWMPVQDVAIADATPAAHHHNQYPLAWQNINRQARAEGGILNDSVVFFRSGHLFSQGAADVMWAGDQRTSFDADDGLPTVLPIGIGLSAVGFPFFTHDIGGYQSSTNPVTSEELFMRWTSLGAFTPIMRTHHSTHARTAHQLFSGAESTAHFRAMAQWHVRLFPYLRALADDAAATGVPLWQPLPLQFERDDASWTTKDEVLLGPSLLVAPVMAAGASGRSVFFPSSRFASLFDDGAVVVGPKTQNVDAALTEIPVFVKAGGIVPLLPDPVPVSFSEAAVVETVLAGDRVVVVGLGADGTFADHDRIYTLTGNGIDARSASATTVVGSGTVTGTGFSFSVQAPAGVTTTLQFK